MEDLELARYVCWLFVPAVFAHLMGSDEMAQEDEDEEMDDSVLRVQVALSVRIRTSFACQMEAEFNCTLISCT